MIYDMFSGLDLYCTDPAQHLTTAGYDLDDLYDLDRDLSDLSVRLDRHCYLHTKGPYVRVLCHIPNYVGLENILKIL